MFEQYRDGKSLMSVGIFEFKRGLSDEDVHNIKISLENDLKLCRDDVLTVLNAAKLWDGADSCCDIPTYGEFSNFVVSIIAFYYLDILDSKDYSTLFKYVDSNYVQESVIDGFDLCHMYIVNNRYGLPLSRKFLIHILCDVLSKSMALDFSKDIVSDERYHEYYKNLESNCSLVLVRNLRFVTSSFIGLCYADSTNDVRRFKPDSMDENCVYTFDSFMILLGCCEFYKGGVL